MEEKVLDIALLKSFSPLDGLKKDNLQSLARKTTVRELPAARLLFKPGDTDKRTYYILSGSVEIYDSDGVVSVIKGGTPQARSPLAPSLPRRFGARAVDDVQYIAIDSDLLDVMLTWDQTGSYEVNELQSSEESAGDDWMTTLLQTKAFHRIPPANIQAIFMRMQRVNCNAGDVVIKQGDEGDYFYVIVNGRCAVTRETPLNKDGIKLAELAMGDTFGEEALISQAKRNATVTMMTEGSLMRLGKDDFNSLMNEPLLQWVRWSEAQDIVARGGKWLDVRLPSEFQNTHLEGAINIPLYFIRLKLNSLEKDVSYVVVCDTGRRSSAGAYILSERGFDAYVLQGGLSRTDMIAPRRPARPEVETK